MPQLGVPLILPKGIGGAPLSNFLISMPLAGHRFEEFDNPVSGGGALPPGSGTSWAEFLAHHGMGKSVDGATEVAPGVQGEDPDLEPSFEVQGNALS
jgi:hypothetical protein